MFSRFNKGITGTKSDGVLDFPKLIKTIQNNPQRIEIKGIRQLRSDGNNEYKALKRQLPIFTPNCLVHERALDGENFNVNFISFSQYIYFDFDIDMNVDDFKRYMVDKYKDKASLICISSSKGGISILFKVSNTLTKDNFLQAWTYVRDNILTVEKDMIDSDKDGIADYLDQESNTVAGAAVETRTETSFEVAVASATVDASITLNFAVPVEIVVTGQK